MSAFSEPLLLRSGQPPLLLRRVPLEGGGEAQFSERWLQEALFAAPEALPVREIDPHIGPLIPVCMEIETGSGPADILYVTPTGQLVLVETKLWRNPEARREVVGQILDYARHLTSWSYDVLEQKAAAAAKGGKNFLLQKLRERFPEADETAYVDGIGRSLKTGDFLLLIVGDGIRQGAESLIGFLERYGHLRFNFGLIEVASFKLPAGETLLVPRILAKTEILERRILTGPDGPLSLEQAVEAEEADEAADSQKEWFAAFWREFIKKLALPESSVMPEPAKSTNQFFWMPPGGGRVWLSVYLAQSTGKAGVYLSFAKSYQDALGILETLEADQDAIEREVGAQLGWVRARARLHLAVPPVSFSGLNEPDDRQRVMSYLVQMTERMVRVLTPRLEAAVRELDASRP
jgi:hypothetical protein